MNKPITSISAIVLTFNEELHIERCIKNLKQVAVEIYVVDSYSTDRTCEIARSLGANVVQHEYIHQAQQFQWALDNLPCQGSWIIRMDADEYLSDQLINEIYHTLPTLSDDITGCYFYLDVIFLGKRLKFGRIHPPAILRLWRNGCVKIEQRWMDEKCELLRGRAITLKGRFVDHNLNGLTWWTQKHNMYSNRELLVEIGNTYHLFDENDDPSLKKRNNKKKRYYSLPPFFRAFLYAFTRYILLGGFFDGRPGLIWAVLQAFWYRFLVDAKQYEMNLALGENPTRDDVLKYINEKFSIKLNSEDKN